jgi:hypothetical protein
MNTPSDLKDCLHIGSVRYDNDMKDKGTQHQQSFIVARCSSCNRIFSVFREEHFEGKVDVGKIESTLAIIKSDLGGTTGVVEVGIKQLLHEVVKRLDRLLEK